MKECILSVGVSLNLEMAGKFRSLILFRTIHKPLREPGLFPDLQSDGMMREVQIVFITTQKNSKGNTASRNIGQGGNTVGPATVPHCSAPGRHEQPDQLVYALTSQESERDSPLPNKRSCHVTQKPHPKAGTKKALGGNELSHQW